MRNILYYLFYVSDQTCDLSDVTFYLCTLIDVKCYLCALVDLLIVCYVRRSTCVTSCPIHNTSHFRRDTPVRARNVRGKTCEISDVKCYLCASIDLLIFVMYVDLLLLHHV